MIIKAICDSAFHKVTSQNIFSFPSHPIQIDKSERLFIFRKRISYADEKRNNSRSIIGHDDRIPIFAPEITILSPVGMLVTVYSDGFLSICTGTLVDRDLVVTAGHCFQRSDGMEAQNVVFAPSLGPDYLTPILPFGLSWASNWTWWYSPGNDIRFVRLQQPLGDVAGTIPLFFADLRYNFNLFGWIGGGNAGYPSDLQFLFFDDFIMWTSACYLREWSVIYPLLYVSDCDMRPGSSGGPFFMHDGRTWGVIAVASAERGEHYAWNGYGIGWGQGANYFMPIFEDYYNLAIQALY